MGLKSFIIEFLHFYMIICGIFEGDFGSNFNVFRFINIVKFGVFCGFEILRSYMGEVFGFFVKMKKRGGDMGVLGRMGSLMSGWVGWKV